MNSFADGDNATAMGQSAQATGDSSTAVGRNSSAGFTNSAAFGAGAASSRDNQMMFGTSGNTYTMAGITSDASTNAQTVGDIELVTTDQAGNLASISAEDILDTLDFDGVFDEIHRDIKDVEEGVAVAMATEDPDLVADESFGIKASYGNFKGSDALGVAMSGVLARDMFEDGRGRLTLSGGLGIGLQEDNVGGRVSTQITW
jgi:hypothetical protein